MYLTKSFKLKISDVDGDNPGVFTGYASTFGNKDIVGDVFDKGAFKRTAKAKGKGLPILVSHVRDQQIGVNLEMKEDEHGLLVKGELMIDHIPKAREVYALIKRMAELGNSMGLSVGFRSLKEKWVKDDDDDDDDDDGWSLGTRHFKEVELFEYSITPFAANNLASVTDVRDAASSFSTAYEIHQLAKRIAEAGYENDPSQRKYLVDTISRLQALVDKSVGMNTDVDDSPDDSSDSVADHSLLVEIRSIREHLAGVGNYGNSS